MQDPWKYLAFPIASVTGYLISQTTLTSFMGGAIGLSTSLSEVLIVGITGLIAGFMVDQVIPAYIEKVRNGGGGLGGGGGDFGGDIDDGDLDFE